MPLRSKEPPERPLAPTDLSHCNLICICHRPLIGHPRFPTRCDLSLFFPHFVLSTHLPSRHLNTCLIPSKQLRAQITQNPPGHLFGRRQTVKLANLAVPPLDRSISRWDAPARSGPISCAISCALFFFSLSSVPLPHSTIRHPPAKPKFNDITARPRRPTHLIPLFLTSPIQSAYLPACHPENYTNTSSNMRSDLILSTYKKTRSLDSHRNVLASLRSRNSSLPPSSCFISSVLPRHRADSRSPSSRPRFALSLSISPSVSPRVIAHPGLRDLVSNMGLTTRVSSRDQQAHLKLSYLIHRTLALPNSHKRVDSYLRAYNGYPKITLWCLRSVRKKHMLVCLAPVCT